MQMRGQNVNAGGDEKRKIKFTWPYTLLLLWIMAFLCNETNQTKTTHFTVLNFISSELQILLKNAVYKELLRLQSGVGAVKHGPLPYCKEPLEFVRVAADDWEAILKRGINTLVSEKNLSLVTEVQ